MRNTRQSQSRWEKAATILLRKTEEGEIEWKEDVGAGRKRDKIYGKYYSCVFAGRNVGVYEFTFTNINIETEDWYEDSGVVVEFIDGNGNTEWVWPTPTTVRSELLDAVRYQVLDGDSFLEEVLEDE